MEGDVVDTKTNLFFTFRVKLPNPAAYSCSPSGDSEYDDAYKKAIADAKPPGFEVKMPRLGQKWAVDSEGYTYVPLYVTDQNQALEAQIERNGILQRKLDQVKTSLNILKGLIG